MADSLFDVGQLPPWMIQRESPADALARGVVAGSAIAHNILNARQVALQEQESVIQQQNQLRMREGLAQFGAYMGSVKDWTDPEAEKGAFALGAQNPWLLQTPAFHAGIQNFERARQAKDAIESRERIASERTQQMSDIQALKSADRSDDNQARMDRLYTRMLLGEDISRDLLQEKARLGIGASIPKEIKIQNDIEQSRTMADKLESEGDVEGAKKLRDRAEALDKTRQGQSTATIREFNFLEGLKKTDPAAAEAFTILQKQKHPDRSVLNPNQQAALYKVLEEQVSIANGGALKDGSLPGPLVQKVAAENAASIQKNLGIKINVETTPDTKTGGILPNAPGGPYFERTVPGTTNVTITPTGAGAGATPSIAPTAQPAPAERIPGPEPTPVTPTPAPPVKTSTEAAPYSQELINASVALTEDKLDLPTVAERYKKVTGNDLPSFVEMTNPKGQKVKVPVAKLVEAVTKLGYKP